MAAPLGNTNAAKSKPWTDAIRRAIARYDSDKQEDAKFLNRLADQLLVDCLNNERDAKEELTNRLDGKVPQGTILSGDPDAPLQVGVIERRIIDANTNA